MITSNVRTSSSLLLKVLANSLSWKLANNMRKVGFSDERMNEKLIASIPAEAGDVIVASLPGGSFYFNPHKIPESERKRMIEACEKARIDPYDETNMTSYFYRSIKELRLLINGSKEDSTAALAHEIGHLIEDLGGWTKVAQGSTFHNLSRADKLHAVSSFILSLMGQDALSVIVPLLMKSPMLMTEFMASKLGYDLLKKCNATPDQLSKSAKCLASAYGTYLMHSLGVSLTGMAYGAPILRNMIKS